MSAYRFDYGSLAARNRAGRGRERNVMDDMAEAGRRDAESDPAAVRTTPAEVQHGPILPWYEQPQGPQQ